jgi:Tfp pilus assembly ATPase PilU
MKTLDQALIELYRKGLISLEETLARCHDPETVKRTIARGTAR